MLPFTLDRTLTWIDLETTGKKPATARICEISIVQFLVDGTTKEWWSLINPGVPIPAEATAKHNITDDAVLGKPRFEDVAHRILPAFRNCDYGGYNVRYDLEVLDLEYARARIEHERDADYDPPPRILDGLRLWQIAEPRALENFVERWAGRKHEHAHNAKADIEGTIEGIRGLLMQVPQDVLPHNMQQLHDLQFPRDPNQVDSKGRFVLIDGVVCFNFGKHAGKPAKAERSYLKWWASEAGRTSEEKALVRSLLA